MSHPEIGSLVRAKDEMWRYLEQKDYIMALRKMTIILSDIKKNDAPDNLFKEVSTEENSLSGSKGTSNYRRQINSMSYIYWEWGRDIVQILWDHGYLADKKYNIIQQDEVDFEI